MNLNLTLHMTPNQPLLLPIVPVAWLPSDDHEQSDGAVTEAHLCYALIERVAQSHRIVCAEPVGVDELTVQLEQWLRQGVTRMLLLPWHLPGTTAQLVQQAMFALHHTGAETVWASSLLLTHPVTGADVSPIGPPGEVLAAPSQLERFVKPWPDWRHSSLVVRSEQVAMLIVHPCISRPRQPGNGPTLDTHHRLHQTPDTHRCQAQKVQEPCGNGKTGQRQTALSTQYFSGLVVAALDALRSLPPVQQD